MTDAPDWIVQHARFHADTATAPYPDYDLFVAELTAADRRLAASADRYERVVIWTEHDSHDQLSLIRCLAQYARMRPPRVLELISVSHFLARAASSDSASSHPKRCGCSGTGVK